MPYIELPFDPEVLNLLDWHQDEIAPYRRESVIEAVDKLPKVEREIVNALFYEGLFKNEIAERLGITKAKLDKHLEAAIERLRRVLA